MTYDEHVEADTTKSKPKNILMLYDDKFSFIDTVKEHLNSFRVNSRHNWFFVPGTVAGAVGEDRYFNDGPVELHAGPGSVWNFDVYDAIVLHYTVRLAFDGYIATPIAERVRNFPGPKILFIQDEYEGVDRARGYIEYLGINVIYTCIPRDGWDFIYPKDKLPETELIQTLTGFVPEAEDLDRYSLPLRDRKTLVGYRGRRLPHHYGLLGYEKFIIGERVREEALRRGLPVDIECDDSRRIYDSWYEFLGSCRATLGTESGSNIFDFDGSLRAKALELDDRPFEEVYEAHFKPYEGRVRMNQISPKFFEAARLRTALVCFPGEYSGILEEGRHYIRLEKDFSNIDQVFERLRDIDFLKDLTDRTYADLVSSDKYSYRTFIKSFDDWLDTRTGKPRAEIITAPIAVRRGDAIEPVNHSDPIDYVLNNGVLGGAWQRSQFRSLFVKPEGGSDGTLAFVNRARAKDGAYIRNATAFHGHPHDADSLLRPFVPGNYAAALDSTPLPHLVEIDLGATRLLEGAFFEWLDTINFGIDYQVEVHNNGEPWILIVDAKGNNAVQARHTFKPLPARFVRLTVTKVNGQQRMLLRRFELYERQVQS